MTNSELLSKNAAALVAKIALARPFINFWQATNGTHWMCGEAKVNGTLYAVSFQHDGSITEFQFGQAIETAQATLLGGSSTHYPLLTTRY